MTYRIACWGTRISPKAASAGTDPHLFTDFASTLRVPFVTPLVFYGVVCRPVDPLLRSVSDVRDARDVRLKMGTADENGIIDGLGRVDET